MKILYRQREQGSVLLTGLIIALAAGIALASYLTLVSNRYRMTVRSMDWNNAIPVLESGIEEALTHLNDDASLTANGWTTATIAGQSVVTKLRTNSDGTYFKAWIAGGLTAAPTIYSSGFVPVPLGKGYITRNVKVIATRSTLFTNAIASVGPINLSGGATVDSYSSCAGPYGGTNSQGVLGNVVTDSKANPAITMSGGDIYGKLNTGPGGVINVSGSASVGDASWNTNSNKGIETGWSNDTMNVSFPSNSPPTNYTSWLSPATVTNVSGITTNTGITSATVLSGNDYTMSSFTSSDSAHPMLITGPSTLYVTGNFTVQGNGYVEILPGGSLTLIVGGSTTTISGGGVVNGTSEPANFSYVGLAGNTSLTYSGNSAFQGSIYAPEAAFTFSGSAAGYGAAIVNSFNDSGGAAWHYDSCLPGMGPIVLTSWQEF
jgi:hypothetical protein